MGANIEGPVSPLVTDAMKFQCENCNGSKFYISTTLDDPNDVVQAAIFAAYDITFASGTSCQGVVVLCVQCGHEQVPYWQIFDVGTTDNGTQVTTMTNLDAGTANTLAGCYGAILAGTDVEKYVVIASHTAAAPTLITWAATKPNVDSDGYFVIQNWLPVGFTAT